MRLPARRITRRQALSGAVGLGAAGLLGCGSSNTSGPRAGRPRVAIVGAGAGGIASAYFLDDSCTVSLFESRSKIGGHCDSVSVDYRGQSLIVDLGAQFFHPATHPIYVTLLEELGLYDPDEPESDETLEAPGSVCVFPVAGGAPVFCSTQVTETPLLAIEFGNYVQLARKAVLEGLDWEMTLGDWVLGLALSEEFKRTLLTPFLAALIGTTTDNARRASARATLQNFALAYPEDPLAGASTFNSSIGLEGNLQRMLGRAPHTRVHLDAAVQSVSFGRGVWTVNLDTGSEGPFDVLVMNAPPHTSQLLLADLRWASDVVAELRRYEYFDSRIVVHTDAAYVHADRRYWTAYNAGVDDRVCEGSVWLGGIHEQVATGGTFDVFKSWAQYRSKEPENILAERAFRHPLITPDAIGAARSLSALQGRNQLYFVGQHTTGMDLQEAAVYSAMKLADVLAPRSAPLAALRARLALRGRADVTYEL